MRRGVVGIKLWHSYSFSHRLLVMPHLTTIPKFILVYILLVTTTDMDVDIHIHCTPLG